MSYDAICQVCWAQGQQVGRPCWLCHNIVQAPTQEAPFVATAVPSEAAIPVDESDVNPYAGPAIVEQTAGYRSSGVLLIVTVTLVGIVFAVVVPGLGIPASLIVVPALIRTVLNLNTKRSQGEVISTRDKVGTFLLSAAASTAAVITAAVAIICAFFTACLFACAGMGVGVDPDERIVMLVMVGGVLAGIGFGVYTFLHLTAYNR